MFSDDIQSFLEGSEFAKLTTLDSTGAPQTTVMWYRLVADALRMIAPAASVKVRHLARDARVAVLIDASGNGYQYVEIRGRAEIVRDDAGAREELRHIAQRYIGDAAEAYVSSLSADPRVIIVIHPARVRYHLGQRFSTSG